MRVATATIFVLLMSCKEMIVPSSSRPKSAVDPPPTPPAVEAARVANCSPQSHFGTNQASDMLKFPMRWAYPADTDCTMAPPADTRPYFWVSVIDGAEFFDNFTQEAGVEHDRDAVAGAKRVAWLPKSFKLVVSDGSRVVTVEMATPNTQTNARMQASVIASKLLAYF